MIDLLIFICGQKKFGYTVLLVAIFIAIPFWFFPKEKPRTVPPTVINNQPKDNRSLTRKLGEISVDVTSEFAKGVGDGVKKKWKNRNKEK